MASIRTHTDMACALCLNDRALKNSHVIPEFMYSWLYDDKHRFHVLSVSEPAGKRWEQKGLREKLLRKDCETQLSFHERYVSRVFSGAVPVKSERNGALVKVEGLDYENFKLFGLSILWRAGVSQHEFFEKVVLGPHKESIRRLVASTDAGHPHQYGFFLAPIVHEDQDVRDLIV